MKEYSSLKDTICHAILEDILSHEYGPKEILNEKTLVEKYGCSKTPVREALLSLCNDNVLRNIPRYGYEIVRLSTDDVRDMLQFRYILESGILSAYLTKFTDSQIARLSAIDEQCTAAGNDVWLHWACNCEFHMKMLTFSNNNYAVEELKKCMDRLKRAYAQFYWDNLDSVSLSMDTRNHSGILQSLREKDLEKLLTHLKSDLNDFGGMEHNLGINL